MSKVHFIGGEKGGVGKSMTSRVLAQYLIDSNKPLIGFDSDQSHGTFTRFYQEFASPLVIDSYASLDSLIEVAEENPKASLIIDLAAQTSSRLGKWMEESDVLSVFDEIGREVYLWHVMDDGADSVALLDALFDRYPQHNVTFVVVCNLGRGENFERFNQSPTHAKALTRRTRFITLGKLQNELAQRIDFNNFSFWAAAHHAKAMNRVERARIRVWLNSIYLQFDQLLSRDD